MNQYSFQDTFYSLRNKTGIYMIICQCDGKKYIGQSVNLQHRLRQHKSNLAHNRHINKHLQSAYNKYGHESFSVVVLEEVEVRRLAEREKYWVYFYSSNDAKLGFNFGECVNNPFLGQKHSQETKDKLRIFALNRIYTRARNLKISQALLGKPRPDIVKEKISKAGEFCHDKEKKKIVLISPTGEIQEIVGIRKFCKDFGISRTFLYSMINGHRKDCKGWKMFLPKI